MSSSNVEVVSRKRKETSKRDANRSSTNHTWTKQEDAFLVQCLHVLTEDPQWKADNGTFRMGYLNQLEKMLEAKIPEAQLKADLHIESIVKLLKRQYNAICEMINNGSGFGWNDEEKCVTASKDVFDDWVRTHPSTKGLRNKCFPHFEDFVIIFGKDRATGEGAKTTADAIEKDDDENDDDDATDNIEVQGTHGGERQEETMEDIVASTCDRSSTSKRADSTRKKARSSDGLSELVEQLGGFATAYKEASQEIKGISSFFKMEAEGNERRLKLWDELKDVEGFAIDDLVMVGEYISRNPLKVDYFFSLPKEIRSTYIRLQLNECNPYRPSFDNFPLGQGHA